jgi:hypothetical protein
MCLWFGVDRLKTVHNTTGKFIARIHLIWGSESKSSILARLRTFRVLSKEFSCAVVVNELLLLGSKSCENPRGVCVAQGINCLSAARCTSLSASLRGGREKCPWPRVGSAAEVCSVPPFGVWCQRPSSLFLYVLSICPTAWVNKVAFPLAAAEWDHSFTAVLAGRKISISTHNCWDKDPEKSGSRDSLG